MFFARMDGSSASRIHALTSFDDDGMQLLALEELNQMLSMGQQGEVRVSVYVQALVKILQRSAGNAQLVLMAARALNQIFDIEPRAGALAVSEGALPALCARLLSMSDLDVAEQCLKCLHILSGSHARDVLHAGGLKAVTAFYDFFPQHLQRRAMETAATICADSGRQIDDAVNVLEALPTLGLSLESSDEKTLSYACQCFARLVSCYSSSSSTGASEQSRSRASQPAYEAVRCLQQFASTTQPKDSALSYVDLTLAPFQPKYSSQWRKQVLTLIATDHVTMRILEIAKKKPLEEGSHLLSALARLARTCPHVIATLLEGGIVEILKAKLSATGSSKSGEGLTSALRFIQAILPPVPHAKAFDRDEQGELCDKNVYDNSLVLTAEEIAEAAARREEMSVRVRNLLAQEGIGQTTEDAGDGGDVPMDNSDDSIWACPICTYHNPKTASSCDMCGQVSPQISERASRMEQLVGAAHEATEADKAGAALDPSEALEEHLQSWEDFTLGIRSALQLFKERPELLEGVAESLLPDLTQVAAKSANPDHRTRALGALASLLYCLPRSVLETIFRSFGPGGEHYVGVVYSGLQSQNPHVVGSALRVAMVELWRLGLSPGLQREGIPQLIRGLGARFPEPIAATAVVDADRIMSVRRRAATWLSYYEYLADSEASFTDRSSVPPSSTSNPLAELKAIAARLAGTDQGLLEIDKLSSGLELKVSISPKVGPEELETPPNKKRRRMAGGVAGGFATPPPGASTQDVPAAKSALSIYRHILEDFVRVLRRGVVSSEFQASGLAQVMAGLATSRPEFVAALKDVFASSESMNSLLRTLQDALDGSERFPVIKHGLSTNDAFRALKSHSRIVVQPTETTLRNLKAKFKQFLPVDDREEDLFSVALKVDPLVGVAEIEALVWSHVKGKIADFKAAARSAGSSVSGRRPSSSALAAAFGSGSQSALDSEREESRYAILQAADPVHVARQLRAGMQVTRGRDWKWGDQDGGPGRIGVITDVRSWNGHPNSCIRVRWDTNKATNVYRYNVESAFDLALAPRLPSRKIKRSGKSSVLIVASDPTKTSTDDFRRDLKRGDEIDAMDTFHRWYRATVRVVVPKKDSREGAARVAFSGFAPRYDEWIPLSSERLAPLGSRVFDENDGFQPGEADDAADQIVEKESTVLGGVISASSARASQQQLTGIAAALAGQAPFAALAQLEEASQGGVHDDEDSSVTAQVKELPSSTRVICAQGDMVLQAGQAVQVKRLSDDLWWDALILQLGVKAKPLLIPAEADQTAFPPAVESAASNDVTMVLANSSDGAPPESSGAPVEEDVEETKTDDEHFDTEVDEESQPTAVQLQQQHVASSTSSSSLTSVLLATHNHQGPVPESSLGGALHALIKPVATGEDEDEEEEEDEDEHTQWINLSDEIQIRPKPETEDAEQQRRRSSSNPSILQKGSAAFARVGILGREGWVPVQITSEDDIASFEVSTRFGEESVESSFAVSRSMVLASHPPGAYAPSAKDLRTLLRALRECEEFEGREGDLALVSGRSLSRQTSQTVSGGVNVQSLGGRDSDLLSRAEATALLPVPGGSPVEADDVDDDPLDEDAVSRSPAPLSTAATGGSSNIQVADQQQQARQRQQERAKALFASLRARMMMRNYSGIDITSELASSSLHHTLSAAAAIASRISLGWGDGDSVEDDPSLAASARPTVPIRLLTRKGADETIHLSLARLAAKDNYSSSLGNITCLEYTLDMNSSAVNSFWVQLNTRAPSSGLTSGDMVEVAGQVLLSADGVYSVDTNFPTMTVRDVEIDEEGSAWYYEVVIVQGGLAQIGWIDADCSCDDANGRGCGDDRHGWAFDGKRRVKWHVESNEWGRTWSDGDVLGVACKIKGEGVCDIFFSMNGSFEPPMGLAFQDVAFVGTLRPAITCNKTFSCRIRLKNFQHAPSDESFQSLGSLIKPRDSQETETEAATTTATELSRKPSADQTVEMDVASDQTPLDLEQTDESMFHTIFDEADALPPAAQVLRLLFDLNLIEPGALVNRRLTNKLVWQLQDALAVCSGSLPMWCFRAVHEFPFLFPIETRQVLFASTAFGVSRGLYRVSNEFEQESSSHRRLSADSVPSSIGTQLKRQKVVLPRNRALETGMKLLAKFATDKCVLTMEFSEEIGHGLGPTLEFYSIVCSELQRRDLHLWRSKNHSVCVSTLSKIETIMAEGQEAAEAYVFTPTGLFPAALNPNIPQGMKARVVNLFRFLGRFIARAILDERLLDLDFSELFLDKLVNDRGEDGGEDEEDLLTSFAEIDPEFARSLQNIEHIGVEYNRLSCLPATDENQTRKRELREQVDLLQMDNILPGTEDVVIPGFEADVVTVENCQRYVHSVAGFVCDSGVRLQLNACREGFNQVFPLDHLRAFTAIELRAMFSGGSNDSPWSVREISDNLILRDYSKESSQITNLLDVLSELNKDERRLFLRFLTGTPRLPVGGWAALRPKMTVVKKSQESEDGLPSCSTCSVVLKLPQYSTKERLREKLLLAIKEGQNFFSMD